MGIKGIYRELGSGRRISLAKLATEKLESSGRPLRIAVDIAIWQFQTQAARGGTNPAIRTLFYRLVRLLGLGIQPIFVFDGPHKPTFKRNKRSGRGDGIATAMAKRVIRLFGFPIHDAPGEAEAECALLQQQGIVDAVLSEDVDTIMFGCTRTLRNWTAEGPRGAKTPTHVSLYDVDELLSAGTGLDREGMVLVALMSGGDYIPEGVPGCGVKLACEAAKAGFGKSLCRLKSDDDVQFEEWRRNLRHELRTNESGFFRVRHKALSIPDEFPSRQVLRHYTHPVVSNAIAVNKLKTEVNWSRPMDVQGLRYFVEETFDWVNKIGAVKLTRVLSPGLLVSKLLARHMSNRPNSQTTEEMEQDESNLVQRITGRRNHHSTDGIPELRVAHIPADIVGLDLSQELDEVVSFDRQGLALNSDDEFEAAVDGDTETAGGKTRAKSTFDPTVAELIWLPESLIKLSAPLTVEDWEEKQRSKALPRASRKTAKTTKINNKKATRATLHEAGALDKWVQITTSGTTSQNKSLDDSDSQLPPLTRPTLRSPIPPKRAPASTSVSSQLPTPLQSSVNRSKQSRSNGKATAAAEPTGHKNPWAHAGSQHMPRITKSQQPAEPIVLSSSPMRASPAPACSSMSPLSPQHIIDLSGPDDTYLFKPSKPPKPFAPHSQQAASRGNQSIKARSMRGSSPTLPCTPPKSKRAMKQTRMDSFITASPKQPVIEESQTQPSTWEGNGSQTYINASQTIVSSSFGYNKQVGTSVSRITKASATWTDYDDDFPPAPKTGALEQTKRMVVPRTSVVGFFKVVEMSDEEEVGRKKTTSPKPFMKSAWRRSEVSIIDLTGDDE
ncbi:flap structure-specific endonuclease protein [Colletotrichum incanum]|uniref:Flap structure-specific endonuclease protein n=1 Tax=Colletotrichum incanum TaxID=1573173 RepID=A0A161VP90_COLIC|nr:flap structure-specific endonuclease protein [Colletotrichum incanum]